MKNIRPYLLRAFYDWIVDSGYTPYILVDAEFEDVCVPMQYVQNGQIVLNISPLAADKIIFENDYVSFNARFSGIMHQIFLPIASILAIYAKENGLGSRFSFEDEGLFDEKDLFGQVAAAPSSDTVRNLMKKDKEKPSLRLIKGGVDEDEDGDDEE